MEPVRSFQRSVFDLLYAFVIVPGSTAETWSGINVNSKIRTGQEGKGKWVCTSKITEGLSLG